MRELSVLRAFAVLSVALAGEAAGQGADCDAVLRLAGRERSIEMSNEMREDYFQSSLHMTKASNVGVKVTDGLNSLTARSGKESSSRSTSQQYAMWKRQYFRDLDRVFEPAVDAWLACKGGKAVIFQPTFIDSREINVSLRSGPGIQQLLGVEPDTGVRCRNGSTILGLEVTVRLDNNDYAIVCRRVDGSSHPKAVRLRTTDQITRLTMPEVIAPLVKYNPQAYRVVLKLTSCDQFQTLPAANRPRQFNISFGMYTNGFSGTAKVFMNDLLVATSYGTRPPNNPNWGTPLSEAIVDVPAGVPVAVHAIGYPDPPGVCHNITGEVRDSSR